MSMEILSSENPSVNSMSPRISFSHDLCLPEAPVVVLPDLHQHLHFLSDSSSSTRSPSFDFDFSARCGTIFDHEPSSADELFSEGKLIPMQIKKPHSVDAHRSPPKEKQVLAHTGFNESSEKETLSKQNEDKMNKDNHNNNSSSSSNSKSFWKFKRSRSLNVSCGSGYGRSLCPLPLLSRSNSTGSPLNDSSQCHYPKQSASTSQSSQNNKNGMPLLKPFQASSSSSSSGHHQKPPLRKNTFRVEPVLHVPSANLFGLGSILLSSKDKNSSKDKSRRK